MEQKTVEIKTDKFTFLLHDHKSNEMYTCYRTIKIHSDEHSIVVDVIPNYTNAIVSIMRVETSDVTYEMILSLLKYIHDKFPNIKYLEFNDNLYIDIDYDRPIQLFYFSIAFNGVTWYEKRCNAKLKSRKLRRKFRQKVEQIMYGKEYKRDTVYNKFCVLCGNIDHVTLQPYYENAETIHDFFTSIPETDRCKLVRTWLTEFMRIHFDTFFGYQKWIMPITQFGGRKTQKNKYYIPSKKIQHGMYQNIGIRAEDV